ncbi:c-type cytochrome [Cupriavidus lacunae]|uniref:c-type cytochrome n=1 Tax=Cupriavidus lacunae TaxID=2666307 RepID=UPI001FC9F60A|nr:c-type cytochrome [Cupriavidus lacunae]
MRRRPTRRIHAALIGALLVLASPARGEPESGAPDLSDAQRVAEQVCAACHGVGGQSKQGAYPSLAGQNADYLHKQMRQFKGTPGEKPLRDNEVMRAVMEPFKDNEMQNLARYFSHRPPARSQPVSADLVEPGRAIYWKGNPAHGLPACVSCHRPAGEGIAPDFPRIGGQQSEYVAKQLRAWRTGLRGGPGKLMSLIVPLMSDGEIEAVAQYVAQLQ